MTGATDMESDQKLMDFFQTTAMEKKGDKFVPYGCQTFWLPFADQKVEGVWHDSYTGNHIQTKYSDWGPGQPNGKRAQNCMEMVMIPGWNGEKAGGWNDAPCHSETSCSLCNPSCASGASVPNQNCLAHLPQKTMEKKENLATSVWAQPTLFTTPQPTFG